MRAVVAAPRPLDADLPLDGAYGRAMALDEAGRFAESGRFYDLALGELSRRDGPLPAADEERLRVRAEKVRWEAEVSGVLAGRSHRSYGATARAVFAPPPFPPRAGPASGRSFESADRRARLARAHHQKLLAARAFLRRPQPLLYKRALELYAGALAERPDDGDRLALAALLWASGDRAAAEREAARVAAPERLLENPDDALDLAVWRAARGDAGGCVAALERAFAGRARLELLASAELDPVRGDPVFRRYVALRRADR